MSHFLHCSSVHRTQVTQQQIANYQSRDPNFNSQSQLHHQLNKVNDNINNIAKDNNGLRITDVNQPINNMSPSLKSTRSQFWAPSLAAVSSSLSFLIRKMHIAVTNATVQTSKVELTTLVNITVDCILAAPMPCHKQKTRRWCLTYPFIFLDACKGSML